MTPMFLIPIPFVFVLLILLLKTAPKAGVWVVGGAVSAVVFATMILLPIGIHDGFVPMVSLGGDRIPLFVVPIPFLFVLLVLLLKQSPKAGATVLIAVLLMGLLGAALWLRSSHQRVAHEQTLEGLDGSIRLTQQIRPELRRGELQAWEGTHDRLLQSPLPPAAPTSPNLRGSAVTSPIWSEGIEHEFQGDIYPSARSAARGLGSRMEKSVRVLSAQGQLPERIVVFRNDLDVELASAFQEAMQTALDGVPCTVDANPRNLEPNEVGIMLRFSGRPVRVADHDEALDGSLEATAFANRQASTVNVSFSDKPWLEDFSGYVSERPDRQVVVARSREACTDENEARQQAIQDTCNQLSAVAGQKWEPIPGRSPLTVSSQDVQEGGFILDQFVQSFDGSAGRIWRQAMLIDASAEKLAWLNNRKAAEMQGERATWARMMASAFGVLVVIVAAYLFLNMATKGYYEWALRIAGTVLAIAGIVSVFLVLR